MSTNLGFNKTSGGQLHFASGTLIKDTVAQCTNVTLEVVDNTKLTSNIIYVVRKSGNI